MEKPNLTRKQQEVYYFMINYEKEFARMPTIREIAMGLGLHSHSTVSVHIKHLREKGWLN